MKNEKNYRIIEIIFYLQHLVI